MRRTLFGFWMVSLLAGVAPAQEPLPLDKGVYTDANGKTLSYRLLKPANYDAKITYPLVLFLHGAGERGDDNEKQLKHGIAEFVKNRKEYPCFLAAPQCPKEMKWADWMVKEMAATPTEPARLAFELLASLRKEFRIDSRRIYVTGLSMGGFGAWDLISRHPEVFAAAAPICGGGDAAQAARIAHIPIWAFHGSKDTGVKPERSRSMIEAIQKAGGQPRYTEYPDVAHASWGPAYKDPELYKWLFAQKRK